MNVLEKIIGANAKKFDALRSVFFPANSSLELLKISDSGANAYDVVTTIANGWYLEYSEFRQQFKLSVATTNGNFGSLINGSSHVRVSGEVYTITNADTLPPQGKEPFWKLFCKRFSGKSDFRGAY